MGPRKNHLGNKTRRQRSGTLFTGHHFSQPVTFNLQVFQCPGLCHEIDLIENIPPGFGNQFLGLFCFRTHRVHGVEAHAEIRFDKKEHDDSENKNYRQSLSACFGQRVDRFFKGHSSRLGGRHLRKYPWKYGVYENKGKGDTQGRKLAQLFEDGKPAENQS